MSSSSTKIGHHYSASPSSSRNAIPPPPPLLLPLLLLASSSLLLLPFAPSSLAMAMASASEDVDAHLVVVVVDEVAAHCVAVDGDDADDDDDPVTSRLLDWLRTNGAYVNDKLVVRRVDPNDATSPRGVFAIDDVEMGETVCAIPWNVIIKPKDDVSENMLEEDDCSTLYATYDAIRGGGAEHGGGSAGGEEDWNDDGDGGGGTAITPYARYLLEQPMDYLPSFWSRAARDLLNDMLRSTRANHVTKSDQLPPRGVDDLISRDVMEWCDVSPERMADPTFRRAVMLVKARADYNYLVPFYDMMNHDNGRVNTAHRYNQYAGAGDAEIKENGYVMVATRRIGRGEEVYNSYNRCAICHAYVDHVHTPEIFYMWGFVEGMPQSWLFDFARVKFELDWRYDVDDDGVTSRTGDVVATFQVPPSERGMSLLREELERLLLFDAIRDDDPAIRGIGPYEWSSLWRYYDALRTALRIAVDQGTNGTMTDEVWSLDDNWWVKDGTITADDDEEHYVYPTINA